MKTYQDYEKAENKLDFIVSAINEYRSSEEYKTALLADEYERQRNPTIRDFVRYLYTGAGSRVVDFTASNNKLANNFFHRLNTQRCSYSLGNGVSFTRTERRLENGSEKTVDLTREALGGDFDNILYEAGYYALIHGVSYVRYAGGWYIFPATQFCPLYDEYTGALRAGIRFWSLDWQRRPATVILYTEDGYTTYRTKSGSEGLDLVEYQPLTAYEISVQETAADGSEIIAENNYGALPIVAVWGSKEHQSTLIGMRDKLDAYDLIQSGFANDLQECAEIYWIVGNAMGMTDSDLAKFRDRLKLNHIAVADTDNSSVAPYTQEIPYAARKEFLESIRASIFEDFGALDVHTISAGQTNDHIDAAYQPLDEEADDFEYQIIKAVRQMLALIGIDDTPQFKRNKISNQKDQTEMILSAAEWLDTETILNKLPFVTVDEVYKIMRNKDAEAVADLPSMDELNKVLEEGNDGESPAEDAGQAAGNGGSAD